MYSQYGEDDWIVQNLFLPEKGLFVEVGGHDGKLYSNTLLFEERGWHGIVVEPNPRIQQALRANRRCLIEDCAIKSGPPSEATFYLDERCWEWSGFKRVYGTPIPVKTKPLIQIYEEQNIHPGGIDILSIDVEGTEIDVWESGKPEIYAPKIVIIEFFTAGLDRGNRESEIREIIHRLPYRKLHSTESNLIFGSIPWLES